MSGQPNRHLRGVLAMAGAFGRRGALAATLAAGLSGSAGALAAGSRRFGAIWPLVLLFCGVSPADEPEPLPWSFLGC